MTREPSSGPLVSSHMAADAKLSLQPSSGEGHAIRATPFIPSSVISDKNLLFTIDRWAPCSGRGMDYQKWMSSIGRLGRAFALGFAEGWTQDATPVNLLVQPSNISPPHSLDVSADDELSRMFAEALDDFDDAPVGTGRERHAFVGETHISPFLSLLLSSASLSPKHCGGRAQHEMLDYMSHHYPSDHQSMLPNEGGHVGQPMLSSGQQSMLPNEGGHDEQSMLPEYTNHNHPSGHQSKLPVEVGHGGQLVLPESVQQNVLPALGTVASLVLDSVDCYHGIMMLATQTKAAQAAYHCLSPAKLQRRKQQKRRRRARLKQLADQQAAKQMRRRTISGKKQRHTHGDVRKKSAANRRHSADRASSWVNSLQGSQLAAM